MLRTQHSVQKSISRRTFISNPATVSKMFFSRIQNLCVVWRYTRSHVFQTAITYFNRIAVEYFEHSMSHWKMTLWKKCFTQICFYILEPYLFLEPYYFGFALFFFDFIILFRFYPVFVLLLVYIIRRYCNIQSVLKHLRQRWI